MTSVFSFPTTIIFGAGCIQELRGRLAAMGVARPLIVSDPGLRSTTAFRNAVAAGPAGAPIFADVESNPSEANVDAATQAYVGQRCDAIIAVGGGSALDVGKLVRLTARFPKWKVRDPLPSEEPGTLAPFIAIPTTAGTGSEVGRSSVVTVAGHKQVIFHPSLLARLVILDPELTVDLPPKLTAATGADALTHCIESFTSPAFHPLCEAIALEGIHLIAGALRTAVKSPNDLDARGKMLLAAMMGAIAFQKDLGAAHSLAHPLSAICNLHHGLANAIVLPAVMKLNASRKPGLYRRVGEAMGLIQPTDQQVIDAVMSLLSDIGLRIGLAAQGVKPEQLDQLADDAFADGCHPTNAVPVTREDLRALYVQAM